MLFSTRVTHFDGFRSKYVCKISLLFSLVNYVIPVFGASTDIDRSIEIQNQKKIQLQIENRLHNQDSNAELEIYNVQDSKIEKKVISESFFISKIELIKGKDSPSINSGPVFSKYEGTLMDGQKIYSLIQDLTNLVFSMGYVTSYVTVDKGNLNTGVLKLSIQWGRISGWSIDGAPPSDWHQRLRLNAALSGVPGRILNIKDIDQAIENLGGQERKATISVVAAKETGKSLLDVHLPEKVSPKLGLSIDNEGGGTASSGRDGGELNASFYDLVGVNDVLKLSVSDRKYSNPSNNALTGYGVDYHVPVGAFSFGIHYNDSSNKKLLNGIYGDYMSNGVQNIWGGRIDMIASRSAASKLVVYANLQTKKINNYLSGQRLAASSGRYTDVGIGTEFNTSLFGGSFFSTTELDRGLRWSNSLEASLDSNDIKKSLTRVTLNGAWSHDVTLAATALSYQLKFGGQYSPATLIPAYKFGVGNAYTVRSYTGSPYSADNGLYLSHTLTKANPYEVIGLALSPLIGIDFATLSDAEAPKLSNRLIGGVVGVTAARGKNSVLFAVGRPFYASSTSGQNPPQTNVVHVLANFAI